MKLDVSVDLHLKTNEAKAVIKDAARKAMRDVVVEIHHDAVEDSPWKTGNNRRSIKMEASGFSTEEGVVKQDEIEGAVYSTSGYGGYLETGTVKMAARPYIKPAADKYVPGFPSKMAEYLK